MPPCHGSQRTIIDKRRDGVKFRGGGSALFTRIHHRETPLNLLAGRVDAGPVWLTEALYQVQLGVPLDVVRLPEQQARRGVAAVAVLERSSPHPDAAQAFVDFMRGPQGQGVLARYGFEGPGEG